MASVNRSIRERVIPPGDDAYLEQAWAVKERIRRSEGVLKQRRAYFEREYRLRAAYLLLSADGEDEVVAFAVVHGDGYLTLLGVAPEYRRRGLGTWLVGVVLDDYPTVTCHVRATNRAAVEFYEHLGFDVEYRIDDYYGDGTDALYLRLERGDDR